VNDAGGILSFLPLMLVSVIFAIFTYKDQVNPLKEKCKAE
jgi:hypothetical protein